MKKSESSYQHKGESEKALETEHRAVLEGTAGAT